MCNTGKTNKQRFKFVRLGKSLKYQRGISEDINRRRTGNAMAKRLSEIVTHQFFSRELFFNELMMRPTLN
jgi:hypothetical protein